MKNKGKKALIFALTALLLVKPISVDTDAAVIDSSKIELEYKREFTESFIEQIRKGSQKLYFNGEKESAGNSLSEVVSTYCGIKGGVTYYEGSGYLEIADEYWDAVYQGVQAADQGMKRVKDFAVYGLEHMNLQTNEKEIVNQINKFICDNFTYSVTGGTLFNFVDSRTGQCWHYAQLMAAMCNAVGIPAYVEEGDNHAWIQVTVNGTRYKFDPTYNDTSGSYTKYSWLEPYVITGWVSSGDSWYYKVDDEYISNCWRYINGEWYCFKEDGKMYSSTWVKYKGEYYYLTRSGAMGKNRWLHIGSKWYYVYADGSMARNTVINGYAVDSNGVWIK